MTPRFKRNADGSYEIGEPSEREGVCDTLRGLVGSMIAGADYDTLLALANTAEFCKHEDIAKAIRLGVNDAKRAQKKMQAAFDAELKAVPYIGPSGYFEPKAFGEMSQPPAPIVERIVDDEVAATKAVSDLLELFQRDALANSGRELIRNGRECTEFFGDDGVVRGQKYTFEKSLPDGRKMIWSDVEPEIEYDHWRVRLYNDEALIVNDPPAHDFTEEEIEAVKAWTIFAGGAVLRAECLFGDRGIGRFPNGKEVTVISNDRVRAIASYLAEKEE